MTKSEIKENALKMKDANENEILKLEDRVCITEYEYLAKDNVWDQAINLALLQHNVVIIPFKEEPYYIANSIIMHSNNRIVADEEAVIKKADGMRVVMLRNENVVDETYAPCPKDKEKDFNISIEGGIWQDYMTVRGVYGTNSVFDIFDTFHGIYTAMLFSNVENVSLKNMKFINSAGFSVQVGNAKNLCFENIKFEKCGADGLHINGNTENVYINHVSGQVGDDIVALNMWDWDNSSINFGPTRNVWCEDVELSADSPYKAIRILPAVYEYENYDDVDCSLENVVFKNIRGINNFKLYLQTTRYKVNEPEPGKVGSGDNIYFEDISIDLSEPIDKFEPYMKSDPVNGAIAGFEFGANIKNISFENIRVSMYRDKFPESYLAVFGPKSFVTHDGYEAFDPYVSCRVENLYLKDIRINDKKVSDVENYVKEIVFDRIYDSDLASGKGEIANIIKK